MSRQALDRKQLNRRCGQPLVRVSGYYWGPWKKSIRFHDGSRLIYLPIRDIRIIEKNKDKSAIVEMPEWLARREGLI